MSGSYQLKAHLKYVISSEGPSLTSLSEAAHLYSSVSLIQQTFIEHLLDARHYSKC